MSRFRSEEVEYGILGSLIDEGDWVIDVGANVGHYTARFSELAGMGGRVIAIEPIPSTFDLLTSNGTRFKYQNATFLNLAASNRRRVMRFEIPMDSRGRRNFYESRATTDGNGIEALAICLDDLHIANRIKLVKIDVEGHELEVLEGMNALILRDRPVIIVEASSDRPAEYLAGFGYEVNRLANSPNFLCTPREVTGHGAGCDHS